RPAAISRDRRPARLVQRAARSGVRGDDGEPCRDRRRSERAKGRRRDQVHAGTADHGGRQDQRHRHRQALARHRRRRHDDQSASPVRSAGGLLQKRVAPICPFNRPCYDNFPVMDYKATLNLPKTDFPMKANLAQAEPRMLKWWDEMGIYKRLRQAAADRPLWILHDGPPYANGNIHMGHVLNKVMKDLVVKSRGMLGFNAVYVPGWDCHGL